MTWEQIDPHYPFQLCAWQHTENDRVLSVEKRPEAAPWDHQREYQVVLLPSDYTDGNHTVISSLSGDVSKDEALKIAETYVENDSQNDD